MQKFVKNLLNDPSIIKIKQRFKLNKFSFQCIFEATVRKEKGTAGEILVNVLKNSGDRFFDLSNCINGAIRNNKFPDPLK